VACFDTSFIAACARGETDSHSEALRDEGVQRYGFHGLSYAYLMKSLCASARLRQPPGASSRASRNGASLAAVRDGKSIDTTWVSRPLGVPMSTRSGDLDRADQLLDAHRAYSPRNLTTW